MGLRDRYRQLPRNPFRPHRRDVVIGIAGAVISGVDALADLVRRATPPSPTDRTRLLRVIDRQTVAHDENVVALRFAAADGRPLPGWHPGAHIDVHLPSGRLRQYSLCGDPQRSDEYRIAVRRIPDGGGGSIEVHDALHPGATVTTQGPRNAFPLTVPGYGSPTTRFRFIAGGIGITPILPMLALAERVGVDWTMVYAGRTRDSLPFLDELARYGERVRVRTDDVNGLPTAAELLGDCPDGTAVYACGPAPMLTAIRSELAGRGKVELHFERFAAPPVVDGEEFAVTVASTGQQIRVGAEETLLAALNRAGVDAPYSCRQGFCGTCRTRVLEGDVDHRDTLLTEPEHANRMMLVCVSRAANGSSLTLDL
ncbi:oxidoreductase [Mycolicibacterium moriokaense]|jgi:ferredoxin-NADP reductase|nr:PDR/VanB family oxidoreductase [Mycolicibacterium moriokaense]MCV7038552.1 oxidoreductase [Mycolicibacterium moriokaense]ORB24793.1 oxidoreductase [Mycolicibacterium moriokaense]